MSYRKTLSLWLAVSHPALPFFVGRDFDIQWEASQQVRTVASFRLTDQRDQTVLESVMDGKWNISNFFFTTCTGICSPIMKNLMQVQRELASTKIPVQFFSHSVTPEIDTSRKLRTYAKNLRLPTKDWFLLTGDREQMMTLARQTYGADTKTPSHPSEKEFVHSENVYLIDGERRIRGIYNGMSRNSLKQLVVDLKEAATIQRPL